VAGPIVFVLAFILAVILASFAVRPLIPVFVTHSAKSRADYVGGVCEVTTGRVDAGFGQGRIDDRGAVLNIPIRCDGDAARLTRGSRALVIDYDEARQAYLVEPYDEDAPGERAKPL
jgi:hypothetical protein